MVRKNHPQSHPTADKENFSIPYLPAFVFTQVNNMETKHTLTASATSLQLNQMSTNQIVAMYKFQNCFKAQNEPVFYFFQVVSSFRF